jgi:hypothetical protein
LVNSHCHRCIRRVPSDIRPVKCDTCSFTLYCSRECKSRDAASHAIICDALKGLSGELSPSINYLPWEILWGHLEVLGAGWADDGELSDLIDMSGASSETSLPWGYKPDEIIDKETLRLVCAIHAKYWADHWAFLLFLVGKGKLCLWFTADRSLKSEHHRLRNRPVVSCTHGPCKTCWIWYCHFPACDCYFTVVEWLWIRSVTWTSHLYHEAADCTRPHVT